MSLVSELGCRCDSCPVNLDEYGFVTEWEDPFFNGKQCLWHKQIRGKKGVISPDCDNGSPCIFVQLENGESFTVSVSELRRWANRIGAKRK